MGLHVDDAVHLQAERLGLRADVVKGDRGEVDGDELPADDALAGSNAREEVPCQRLKDLVACGREGCEARLLGDSRRGAAESRKGVTSEPIVSQDSKTAQPSLSSGGISLATSYDRYTMGL
jgi:hypothetical protein